MAVLTTQALPGAGQPFCSEPMCPGAWCWEERLVLWELGFYSAGRKHGHVAASLLYSLLTGTGCELFFNLVKGDSLRGTRITHRLFKSLSCEVCFFQEGVSLVGLEMEFLLAGLHGAHVLSTFRTCRDVKVPLKLLRFCVYSISMNNHIFKILCDKVNVTMI